MVRSTARHDLPEEAVERLHVLHFTFPNGQGSPTNILYGCLSAEIPLHSAREFVNPKFDPCARFRREAAALMAMPKATMNEHRRPILREDDVRSPWKLPFVQTKSESCSMQVTANHKLRLRIAAADAGHHPRPGALIDYVRHVIDCARRGAAFSQESFSAWLNGRTYATMCVVS
jgi:hypothetical protein